ncbi:unnamed protein product, partial [Mesorhabditis spiculigera]
MPDAIRSDGESVGDSDVSDVDDEEEHHFDLAAFERYFRQREMIENELARVRELLRTPPPEPSSSAPRNSPARSDATEESETDEDESIPIDYDSASSDTSDSYYEPVMGAPRTSRIIAIGRRAHELAATNLSPAEQAEILAAEFP